MIKKTDRTRILFDLESTCWDDKDFQKKNSEIIEIGAVKFDAKSFDIIDTFQTFVKPVIQPVLSEYCTNLTTITQDQVEDAPLLPDAYNAFMDWAGDCPLFIGWGETDWFELYRCCHRWYFTNGLTCFPQRKYMNGKQLYTYYTGIRGGGLAKRLVADNLDFEGTHHRALNDALMTLKLLRNAWFEF